VSPLARISWINSVAGVRLPPTAYRLAMRMAWAATDGTGTAWESRPNMARAINCDEARLPAAFRALESAGLIRRGSLGGPTGRQTYRWHLVNPHADAAPAADAAPGAEAAPGADAAPGAEPATDPVRNPQRTRCGTRTPTGVVRERDKRKAPASPPSHAGQGATTAAATLTRVEVIDKAEAAQALVDGDLCRLLQAMRCTVDKATNPEWPRADVTGGLVLHTVAAVLYWRICQRDPVRMPSGFQKARKLFNDQPDAERRGIIKDACEYLGIACPAMKAPTAPERIAS